MTMHYDLDIENALNAKKPYKPNASPRVFNDRTTEEQRLIAEAQLHRSREHYRKVIADGEIISNGLTRAELGTPCP